MTSHLLVFCYSGLKKTLDRELTENKGRANRILDDELASIVSKEYNPNKFTLRESSYHKVVPPINTASPTNMYGPGGVRAQSTTNRKITLP